MTQVVYYVNTVIDVINDILSLPRIGFIFIQIINRISLI